VASGIATADAAKAVGIDRITLQRWIRAGKVKAPKPVIRGGRAVRLWSSADVGKLLKVKEQIHRKGRGRKSKLKH
jgi:predicted site-specific integrase-resolvase